MGSGGREHTLVWKLSQSPKVTDIYTAPGNAGTSFLSQNLDIKADDVDTLVRFALDNKIDLTVIGPEGPLAAGIVDAFQAKDLRVFGPNKTAAQIEASKVFQESNAQIWHTLCK